MGGGVEREKVVCVKGVGDGTVLKLEEELQKRCGNLNEKQRQLELPNLDDSDNRALLKCPWEAVVLPQLNPVSKYLVKRASAQKSS